jgi:hypothetical protein
MTIPPGSADHPVPEGNFRAKIFSPLPLLNAAFPARRSRDLSVVTFFWAGKRKLINPLLFPSTNYLTYTGFYIGEEGVSKE